EYVGDQDFGYDTLPGNSNAEGNTYDAFVTSKGSRTPVLYVGANDGMLHALNASTGAELFDYVPRGVYSNLTQLTDPGYGHQYFVDGSPQAVDAYVTIGGTTAWHTLLAGSTGAGGKDVFLLDVTDPTSFGASDVLWDYDGASRGDNNMGYTIGQPTIARMHDGNWYMIFSNGFGSSTGDAVLYMYNINTGNLLTFDTKKSSTTTPDGMAPPLPVDYDGDRITDAIYAGDLRGNLWKIDVSSTNPSQWDFALKSGSTAVPLFSATDSSGNVQPITERPQAALDNQGRVLVYFGTGTYFQVGDNTVPSNPPVQSFYGIIDNKSTSVSRSNLLQQSILAETTVNGASVRVTSNNSLPSGDSGWYMDLNYPSAQGERVVSTPIVHSGRIIFTTLIPEGDDCQYGGTSWLMELDASTGSRLSDSPFELNGDNLVNSKDLVTVTVNGQDITVAASGKQSTVGIIQTPGIISGGSLEYKYYSGSTGKVGETTESVPNDQHGRLSWRQLLP
ncbi:MAG TPA: PilC/PilY family type IV pilus protein, partial [Gammaproteobacteria bacterium]